MKIVIESAIEAKCISTETKNVIAEIQKGYVLHVTILEEDDLSNSTNFDKNVISILNMNLF